jgi:hypothetical protein
VRPYTSYRLYNISLPINNIVFKHPVALLYHLFHTIYFRLQCNLILSSFLLTTCFGSTRPSSGVAKIVALYGMFNISCTKFTTE